MSVYLVNFLIYSMAMVGILFLCVMVYKKTSLSAKCNKNADELSVENALNLSQRKTLYVIKAGDERFLIAADTERTSLIAKLNESQILTSVHQEVKPQERTEKEVIIPVQLNKAVDYSEVMSTIRKVNRIKKGNQKPPVMKEMLRKLSEPILEENNKLSQ